MTESVRRNGGRILRARTMLTTTTGIALAAMMAGCATTQQVTVDHRRLQASCAFLGNAVCSQLTPSAAPGRFSSEAISGGGDPVATLRYINPRASWTKYKQVLIAPVTFWGDDINVSPKDQHALADYFYQVLQRQMGKKFKIVQTPTPGAITIQVALIDAQHATPGLRTISMVVPQARALGTLKYLATGTYAFVGGATAEVKIMDSVSHQVLAAAVDRRVGGGSLQTAAQWEWGDAENAMNAWAEQLTNRLSSWTSGNAQP